MINTQQQGQQNRQTTGEKRSFSPRTGIFNATVAAINPSQDGIAHLLNKDTVNWNVEYTGTSQEGERKVNIDIWLKEVVSKEYYRLRFSIVEKDRISEKGNIQWVNTAGKLTWGASKEEVGATERNADFITREFRQAMVGEENLFDFLNMWLLQGSSKISNELIINPDMKAIFDGNFSELQALVPDNNNTVTALATISENGDKQYQNVWKQVLPGFLFDKIVGGDETGMIGRWKNTIVGTYGVKDKYELVPLNATQCHSMPLNATQTSKPAQGNTQYNHYGPTPTGLGGNIAAQAEVRNYPDSLPF